ncbi:cyclic pyranopterin phosphate synthase [Dehalogenimonas formicexedens]|uniref:Cyclic pyranopterin phosphate synthase n=1 Tax=Dehalogenimonas formicexedens TaxID=1839801 RepID=A0A1P8F5W0_9CHLR|nr:radical SAM protein [Dehalogenimonas formicexedens]APV43864.1 cyclic pyranopterin phosphate synthase [Dehalogenimonas formicexedens]
MNLVLARNCTNSCAYCFETAERQGKFSDFISMENVSKFTNWARSSNLEYLSLLGGEPFLHPELNLIVKTLRQTCPTTNLRILTGGVFNKKLLDNLLPEDFGLVFNVNEPRDYKNPKHFSKVINNIQHAIKMGFRVVLGFNVWRTDFDPQFMPELANSLARTNFRWTVANPQIDFPSKVVNPSQYAELSNACFTMLQEASRLNLDAMLDCPVPLCFFNESQLAWVRQYHPGTSTRIGTCGPVLDVTPELEVLRCFAFSRIKRVNLLNFNNQEGILNWYHKRVDTQMLKQGTFEKCNKCDHFRTGRCYGGCLAWHDIAFNHDSIPSASDLALKMQKAIADQDYTLVLTLYREADIWARTAVPTYIAAEAANKLGQWKDAFRFAALAQDMTEDSSPELKHFVKELMLNIP